MTPIKRKDHGAVSYTLDPIALIINTVALGDAVAAAPVVKHLLDQHYVTPESHIVVASKSFRELFPFVGNSNWRNFEDTDPPLWGIPTGWPMALLNKKSNGFTRTTPKAMHLSTYASIALADCIIPSSKLAYVPIRSVDVSSFRVDFSKAVVLVTTYRDECRMWHSADILELAAWIRTAGLIPVFVGKEDQTATTSRIITAQSSLPADVSEYGVDLRNRTSLLELASIMDQAVAVCGVDSGPIHLAGTTQTPIVCGYPTVAAEYRIPNRAAPTYAITPTLECANCESRWRTSFHNFEKCYYGHSNCCKEFTADKFISHLQTIIG